MKLHLGAVMALSQLMETFKGQKLNMRTAYKINQLLNSIQSNVTFCRQQMQELIREFGEIDENGETMMAEDGNGFVIKEDMRDECQKKIAELNEIQADIADITFTLDEFDKFDISVEDMHLLMPFVKEEE